MDIGQPKTIGKYEILNTIGRGGMGVVYRALDPKMGRHVAIKTVTEGLAGDESTLQRIYSEAEKMGMLRHDNIITVFDLGEQNGFPYIVMELVPGEPLDRLMHSGQSFSLFFKLRIIEQICNALAYAHMHDVIHRDVKPANVMVRADGFAKLLDFGIAREEKPKDSRGMLKTGGVIGTVPYMAPERLRGESFDGRSDIFSVGILLYQLLTGQLPYTGTEYVLTNQLLNDPQPSLVGVIPEHAEALDAILDRALAKSPFDRYQTADEMSADLFAVIEPLRKSQSEALLEEAELRASQHDFLGAQTVLTQLLEGDPTNVRARTMKRDVGLRISERTRLEQADRLKHEASDALRDAHYDVAIRLLEEARVLVPANPGFTALLEEARSKKQTNEQILSYLQRADSAKRKGDYTAAREIVEKALELDTTNTRLRAAYQSLIRQAETAALQARLRALLDEARSALAGRKYDVVIDKVKQAEALDANHPEAQTLLTAAKDGIAREERRLQLEELSFRIDSAETEEDFSALADHLRSALEVSPTDATLLRYGVQVDRRLEDFQRRRAVEEALTQARSLAEDSPLKALSIVREGLIVCPGEERLIALENWIQDRIGHLSAEESRAALLRETNEAMRARKFTLAVSILERCQPQLMTAELNDLLLYAREEARREEEQSIIAQACTDAQVLLKEEKLADCIALLHPLADRTEDPRLIRLLEQAKRTLEERNAESAAALALLKPFADEGCHEQILSLIASLPPHTASLSEVESLRQTSEASWEQERLQLETTGRAYATLAAGEWDSTAADTGSSALPFGLWACFSERRTHAADTLLSTHVQQLQQTGTANPPTAERKALFSFASESLKNEWRMLDDRQSLAKKAGALFARRNKPSAVR